MICIFNKKIKNCKFLVFLNQMNAQSTKKPFYSVGFWCYNIYISIQCLTLGKVYIHSII